MSVASGCSSYGDPFQYALCGGLGTCTRIDRHVARSNLIGPAGPQVIQGTVNDPVKFPEAS